MQANSKTPQEQMRELIARYGEGQLAKNRWRVSDRNLARAADILQMQVPFSIASPDFAADDYARDLERYEEEMLRMEKTGNLRAVCVYLPAGATEHDCDLGIRQRETFTMDTMGMTWLPRVGHLSTNEYSHGGDIGIDGKVSISVRSTRRPATASIFLGDVGIAIVFMSMRVVTVLGGEKPVSVIMWRDTDAERLYHYAEGEVTSVYISILWTRQEGEGT